LGPLLASNVLIDNALITHAHYAPDGGEDQLRINASELGLASPNTKVGRRTNLADAVRPKHRLFSPSSLPVSTEPTFQLTFTAPDLAVVNSTVVGSIVNTGNQPQAWSITPPAGITVTPSSGTLAAGATQALTITPTTAGDYSLTLVAAGATITGNPQALAVAESPPPEPPVYVAANEMRVSLPSGSATDYPLQFGRAFRYGEFDYPRVLLDGTPLTTQCDIKTRHIDGTVKFAVISVVLPTLGTTERALTFDEHPSPPTEVALSRAAMLADFDFDATIDVRVSGTSVAGAPASARAMLTALSDSSLAAETAAGGSGPRYWTRGPVCTTVLLHDHAAKAYDLGPTANRCMRPTFLVQFWPGINRFHVRLALESSDVTKLREHTGLQVIFSTGQGAPVERLNQSGVNLFMGSFASRAYWGGTAVPRANVSHGLAYLSEARVIPNFDPSITPNATAIAAYATRLSTTARGLGASGDWTTAMSNTGGRQDIGIMPKWDVLALYSGAAHMHEYAEMQAEFAGWWNMHFREGNAAKTMAGSAGIGRVLSKMAGGRPTQCWFAVTPAAGDELTYETPQSGRDGWGADDAHTPGLYFVQYLTTGSYFWHERLLQLGAYSFFFVNPGASFNSIGNGRASADLVLNGVQVRSIGWQLRNRARAGWAAVDGSPEKTLFDKSMQDALAQRAGLFDVPGMMTANPIRVAWNANHAAWWTGSVATPRPNAMGWGGNIIFAAEPNPTDGNGWGAVWQQNYNAVALAHAADLGYADAKLLADWYARPAIDIANSSQPRHLGDYWVPCRKTDGTFYQSAEAIWATYPFDADGADPTDMPANPALGFPGAGAPGTTGATVERYGSQAAGAIASTQGASGAAAAWAVVRPWHEATSIYNLDPRWAIIPRG
jgi:hypothetical protein